MPGIDVCHAVIAFSSTVTGWRHFQPFHPLGNDHHVRIVDGGIQFREKVSYCAGRRLYAFQERILRFAGVYFLGMPICSLCTHWYASKLARRGVGMRDMSLTNEGQPEASLRPGWQM